jgi:S1-C subfamily serine protease
MTRRQLAVPMVAALLGGAVTAAGMLAGSSGSGGVGRQQGLLALDTGGETFSASELYRRAAPSVVSISARTVQPGATAFQTATGGEIGVSTGSGFVLDEDGRIVTNAHIVSGVTDVQVTFPNSQMASAEVIGKDEETDLAVLRVSPDGLDLRPLELSDAATVQPGDRVVAVGNPTGLQAIAGTGRISAAERRVEAPGGYVIEGLLETDAVIEPATSGGPLLGADGRVVGITSRLGEDTGYAVPADVARSVLAQLEDRHKVIRPWLGLRGREAPDGLAVIDVSTGGPADRASLRAGDVVQSIDGVEVRTFPELLDRIDERAVGDTVELDVLRSGAPLELSIRLEERPATLPAG